MSEKELNDILKELTEKAKGARKKLMLLDFDGTLVEFTPKPSDTEPSEELLDLLFKIAVACENQLVIITGRKKDDIDRMVGRLPVDIIAEHGAIIRENGVWGILINALASWKDEARSIMDYYCRICPDSFIEEKHFSIAWHYRNVGPVCAGSGLEDLRMALEELAGSNKLKILNGNKVIELIDPVINKGSATRYFLNKHDYDYILSVGDDRTDEDMFCVLLNLEHAVTVKIGDGITCAKYRLDNIGQVLMLLENFKITRN
jgi:trehalose 6-phosphate synthase/phosphatase